MNEPAARPAVTVVRRRYPVTGLILIALIAAVSASAVTFFAVRSRKSSLPGTAGEISLFQPVSSERRQIMQGRWNGTVEQDFHGRRVRYPCDLTLEIQEPAIRGHLHLNLVDEGKTFESNFDLSGGFLRDRFIRFDYTAGADGAAHFGCLILELSQDGAELAGSFVALGSHSGQVVSGPIRFAKSG